MGVVGESVALSEVYGCVWCLWEVVVVLEALFELELGSFCDGGGACFLRVSLSLEDAVDGVGCESFCDHGLGLMRV